MTSQVMAMIRRLKWDTAGQRNAAAVMSICFVLTPAKAQLVTFKHTQSVATGQVSSHAALGDVTGDGKPDLIVTNAQIHQNCSLLVNLGTNPSGTGPVFASPVSIGGTGAGAGDPRAVCILDLNGDGANDLLIAQRGGSSGAGALRVQLNLSPGHGQFGPPQTFGPTLNVWSMRVADLDGDGHIDAVIAHDQMIPFGGSGAWLAVYMNQGDGSFAEPHHHLIVHSPITYVTDVVIGDVDGDGLPDLIGLHGNQHLLTLMRNLGNGEFAPAQPLQLGFIVPFGVELADLDQDGDLDLVWANQSPAGLLVARNNGRGLFAQPTVHAMAELEPLMLPVRIGVGDFNLDGAQDIAIAGRIILNDGSDGFGAPIAIDSNTAAATVNIAFDIDLDGDVDALFLRDGGAQSIATVLLNQGLHRPGDINGDGVVGVSDLLAVINQWGACPLPPATCSADVAPQPHGDGTVNVADLLMVIQNWG